jgi:hypothetical protein
VYEKFFLSVDCNQSRKIKSYFSTELVPRGMEVLKYDFLLFEVSMDCP